MTKTPDRRAQPDGGMCRNRRIGHAAGTASRGLAASAGGQPHRHLAFHAGRRAGQVAAGSGGSIVAVSSISGTVADRDMGAHCVSKAGVDMLVKVAAVEWGGYGIRVNAVGPGVTRTPMLAKPEQLPGWVEGLSERTALGRPGEAADVAGAIVGVLELPWVTGQVVHADGGLALHSPIDVYGQMQRLAARNE
jgi:NAD(P)-dependent dehydrogenase (short-subunit alcohol dehydrogenase family)